jgi:hypothetical protein
MTILILATLLCWLSALPTLAAGVVQDTVLQETLVLLDERLNGADPVHATHLFADVGERAARTPPQVREHLLLRLRDFDNLADTDTTAWKAALDLRARSMSKRQVERLLRELSDISERVLRDDSDYLVGTGIRWAAHEARVPEAEATLFTRHLVAHGVIDTTTEWIPEQRGLMVSGWTEPYESSLNPLYVFFDTDEEAYVREAMRDIQRFVVPRVVSRLPASRGVKYAVRDRNVTPLIDPEFNLRIRVLSMRFGGTNADLLPCMDVSVSLIATATEINTWQSTIAHCTVVNGSATTNELDNFYEEMADLIYERVDGYFETR